MAAGDFYRIVTAAIADFVEHGFDTQTRLDQWIRRIRESALRSMVPFDVVERDLRRVLERVFRTQVVQGAAARSLPKVARYTLARVRPQLQAELDRRIAASASLIRLNRAEAMETTLRRFAGWSTSIPPGGTEAADKRAESVNVRKALAQLPYRERFVAIDQGHKLAATIKDVVARDAGALAGVWQHVRHGAEYSPRPEHVARNGTVWLIRGTWADERRLVKPDKGAGYMDEIEQPAELPYCRCSWIYKFSLGALPSEMLTAKGRASLEAARSGRLSGNIAA